MAERTIWYMFQLVQKGSGQMAQLRVEAEGVAQAAPEVVWELVANADSYQKWGPWNASGYQSPADQAGDGAGVIRWMRYGRTTTGETVLESEPPRRLVYTVVKGHPGAELPGRGDAAPAGGRYSHPLDG